MAKRERTVKSAEEAKLDLTPMIDVVFQLIIFFIVTIKPEDILAHLEVFRPAPDPTARPEERVDDMIEIGIYSQGVMLNKKRISVDTLEKTLVKMAGYSTTQTILIKCAPDSPHDRLVTVLNLCAKAKLTNLSVVSL